MVGVNDTEEVRVGVGDSIVAAKVEVYAIPDRAKVPAHQEGVLATLRVLLRGCLGVRPEAAVVWAHQGHARPEEAAEGASGFVVNSQPKFGSLHHRHTAQHTR